jgi:hypothetical protein
MLHFLRKEKSLVSIEGGGIIPAGEGQNKGAGRRKTITRTNFILAHPGRII